MPKERRENSDEEEHLPTCHEPRVGARSTAPDPSDRKSRCESRQRTVLETTLLLCGAWNLHTRLRPRGGVGLNLREMEEGADAAKVMAKGEEERHVQRWVRHGRVRLEN